MCGSVTWVSWEHACSFSEILGWNPRVSVSLSVPGDAVAAGSGDTLCSKPWLESKISSNEVLSSWLNLLLDIANLVHVCGHTCVRTLGIKPRALSILSACSLSEPHPET